MVPDKVKVVPVEVNARFPGLPVSPQIIVAWLSAELYSKLTGSISAPIQWVWDRFPDIAVCLIKWGTIVSVSVSVAGVPHPVLDVPVTVILKIVVDLI